MPDKVERGGEVQPDTKDKGSDADKARHEQGIPASADTSDDQPTSPVPDKPKG